MAAVIEDEIAGKALQNNWTALLDQLNLEELIPSLFQEQLIDFFFKRDLEVFRDRRGKITKFLDHLREDITKKKFEIFIGLLRNDKNCKHQKLARLLNETFEEMKTGTSYYVDERGDSDSDSDSDKSDEDPEDSTEVCKDHHLVSASEEREERTSHHYNLRRRSSGRSSFVEEPEDDFIVQDLQHSTDRNNQDKEMSEVDTMDLDIDEENNGQGSSTTGSVANNEHPLRRRRSSSSVAERQSYEESNGTPPKHRAKNCHSNDWIRDVQPRPFPYIPQLGDKVRFIVNAYEEYKKKLHDEYDYTLSESYHHWNGMEIPCQLVDVQCKNVEIQKNTIAFYVLDFKPTREAFGEMNCEHTIKIRYCNLSGAADFLVLAEHYDCALRTAWEPSNSFLTYLDNEWIDGEVVRPYPMKHGQHYKVLVDGKPEHLAPWEMFRQKTWPLAKYDLNLESLRQAIILIRDRNEVSQFQYDVNHPEYRDCIAIPMCISTIHCRIINKYYRSLLSVLFDIRLIYLNAFEFNDDGNPKGRRIIQNAHKVVHSLYHVAQSTTDNTEDEEGSGAAVELLHKVDDVLSKESFEERYPLRVQPPQKTRRRVRTRLEESDEEY